MVVSGVTILARATTASGEEGGEEEGEEEGGELEGERGGDEPEGEKGGVREEGNSRKAEAGRLST